MRMQSKNMLASSSSIIVLILVLFQNFAIDAHVQGGGPIAETKLGAFEGTYSVSRDGKQYSTFRGIRYASVGQRFEAPKPITDAWKGTKKATAFGSSCPQFNFVIKKLENDEDCLFLNIYTPESKNGKNRPVLVYIHGGGWVVGSSRDIGEKYFMNEDIVLVTINYRLGALGFLSTTDGRVGGNMGQKDQVMALRWVRDNIEAFGGDKTKVTIDGTSAGAASVAHLIVSPMAKGLFHGAIIQSGSVLNPWSWMNRKFVENTAFELGSKLGCASNPTQEFLSCLRNKTTAEIVQAQGLLAKWYIDPLVVFAPTIEIPSAESGVETFLEESPRTILDEGRFNKVPVIMTLCRDEGLFIHSAVVSRNKVLAADLDQNWTQIAPITLTFNADPQLEFHDDEEKNKLSAKTRQFYFGTTSITEAKLEELTNIYTDRGFLYGAHSMALLLGQNGVPVYPGVFSYIGGENSVIFLFGINEILGVSHGDDTQYLFNGFTRNPLTEASNRFSKYVVNMWANFVKTGIPKSDLKETKWPTVTLKDVSENSLTWLELNNKTEPELLVNPYKTRNDFWDKAYREYGIGRKI